MKRLSFSRWFSNRPMADFYKIDIVDILALPEHFDLLNKSPRWMSVVWWKIGI